MATDANTSRPGKRKRDNRVEINGKKYCVIPCIKREISDTDYVLAIWPSQFALVEFHLASGSKRRYPVEVLRCLSDPDTGSMMFEALLYDRASDARLKGCEVTGRLTSKDVIMTGEKEILDVDSVVGEAQVIFDARRYQELEERHPCPTRYLCIRREKKKGDALEVVPLQDLTPKQQYQSQLWGLKGEVLPSHGGILNVLELKMQVRYLWISEGNSSISKEMQLV